MRFIKLKDNLWTLAFVPIGMIGFFLVFFHFNMFGQKIDYIKDLIPMLYGILCFGFSVFFLGIYFDGIKGGLKYLRNWLVLITIAYLFGFFKNTTFFK
jgi:hypothetical protein